MLYESHEVSGYGYPVFKEKQDDQFTIEDILNTNQSMEDFVRFGFIELQKYQRTLYRPIYIRKEGL